MAAFPEMKILTVDVRKWLPFPQLIHLYSVGQIAPGPNMMMTVVAKRVEDIREMAMEKLYPACGDRDVSFIPKWHRRV